MSLPSLSTVLRGILPGSPPHKGHKGEHRAAGAAGAAGSTSAAAGGQPPSHQDLALTPEETSQHPETSGGYRCTREELDVVSKIESPGGGRTGTYWAGGGRSWGGSSWGGSDYEGGGPSSSDYEAGMQQHQRGGGGAGAAGASSTAGGVLGGGAYGLSSGCISKRAKLTSRSLSSLSDEPVNGMGIMEGSDVGGTGGGARARGGSLVRSISALKVQRSGSVFEHSTSHSTQEWCAMSTAGRVLGVDSLEERDVEDKRRAMTVEAARILGVVNVAELQPNATAAHEERQTWAPPRSSASKAARRLGKWEGRRRREQTTTQLSRFLSLPARGGKADSGSASKPKLQHASSSLIRLLGILESSEAGSSEDGDCSSLDYNGSEDLTHRKGRWKHETGSNRSTRATESCSSVSDLAHTDPDGLSYYGGSSRGDTSVYGQDEAHQEQQQKQQQHKR